MTHIGTNTTPSASTKVHGFESKVLLMCYVFARDRNWTTLVLRLLDSHFIPCDARPVRAALAKAHKSD